MLTALVIFAVVAPSTAPSLTSVVVRASDLDEAEVVDELALRLPHTSVSGFSGGTPATEAIVNIRREAAGYRVVLVLRDGRAYERNVEAGLGDDARAVATTLANLITAIHRGVAPDRTEVSFETEAPGDPAVTVEDVAPPGQPPDKPAAETAPGPVRPANANVELGATVRGGVSFVAGAPPLVGGGGVVGIDLRWAQTAIHLGVFGGAIGRNVGGGAALVVGRTGAELGWAPRWKRVELLAALGVRVSPWFVRRSGQAGQLIGSDGVARPPPPMIGGSARVELARRWQGARATIQFGPYLAAAYDAAPGTGPVALRDPADGRIVAQLGGLGFDAGVALRARLAIKR